ncbi:hypothetical protein PVK06_008624 [Gossypium arboreum]|uniref:DUF4283 domain-containing protein n=1 Tax=Gossypium arboreum TaxID=29729 RepID=A0ABR0QKG1_GOSAR|nr:hypothetical protein PVK06_008624 [Gossypium arboreum]
MKGYKYLAFKLDQLWQPKRDMKLIDLGHDCFLVKLENKKDNDHIFYGGSWLIRGRFLTIRKLVPNFRTFKPSFDPAVLWIQFLELHIKDYATNILCKIDTKLGGNFWIDSVIMNNNRGKFIDYVLNWI